MTEDEQRGSATSAKQYWRQVIGPRESERVRADELREIFRTIRERRERAADDRPQPPGEPWD